MLDTQAVPRKHNCWGGRLCLHCPSHVCLASMHSSLIIFARTKKLGGLPALVPQAESHGKHRTLTARVRKVHGQQDFTSAPLPAARAGAAVPQSLRFAGGFTSDGKVLVTAGGEGDSAVRVWNPKTGECIHTMAAGFGAQSDAGLTCLAFADDPAIVAAGAADGAIVLLNAATGKAVAKMEQHSDSIEAVAFVPGLHLLASCSLDGKAVIWDTTTHAPRCTCDHRDGVTCMAVQPGGHLLATGCLDGAVCVFDARDGRMVEQVGGGTAVQCLAWSADGKRIATGADDGVVRVFDRS